MIPGEVIEGSTGKDRQLDVGVGDKGGGCRDRAVTACDKNTLCFPCSIDCWSRCSSSAGSTTSRSKPAVVSASRAASAFPHFALRNAFSFEPSADAGAGCVAGIGRKREEGSGNAAFYLYKKDAGLIWPASFHSCSLFALPASRLRFPPSSRSRRAPIRPAIHATFRRHAHESV